MESHMSGFKPQQPRLIKAWIPHTRHPQPYKRKHYTFLTKHLYQHGMRDRSSLQSLNFVCFVTTGIPYNVLLEGWGSLFLENESLKIIGYVISKSLIILKFWLSSNASKEVVKLSLFNKNIHKPLTNKL